MSNKPFAISLIILLSTILLVALISRRGEPVVIKTNLENLPMETAGFKATEGFLADSVFKELNTDISLFRHYRIVDGKQVNLYIGYYGTAKGGRTTHGPDSCLPAAGWGIINSFRVTLRPKYYPKPVDVNIVLAQKGEGYETILHWYHSDKNKVLSTGIQQNIQRFISRVFHNRNDGAFVQISVFSEKKGIEEANLLAKIFAEKVLDLLPEYWPLEQ